MNTKKTIGTAAGIIAIFILLGWLLFQVPKWQTTILRHQATSKRLVAEGTAASPPLAAPSPVTFLDVFSAEDRARQTLATIIGGFLVLVGAYMTWRTVRAAEKNAEIAQDKQVTDNFTKAVEMLGNSDHSVRAGGIYALERFSRYSEDDHNIVMQILCSYVQENSHSEISSTDRKILDTRADILAAMSVLGRRKWCYEGNPPIDKMLKITYANFYGALFVDLDFSGMMIAKSRFNDSALIGSNFSQSNLIRSDFTKANLVSVNFESCRLNSVNFTGADLRDAILKNTDLTKAIGLTQEQLDLAITDATTKVLPPLLIKPAAST